MHGSQNKTYEARNVGNMSMFLFHLIKMNALLYEGKVVSNLKKEKKEYKDTTVCEILFQDTSYFTVY